MLAVADLHGKEDHLAMIAAHLHQFEPNLLILAGDIFGRRGVTPVEDFLAKLSIPTFIVAGNSDPAKAMKKLEKISQVTHLHPNPIEFSGIPFIGLGGAVPIPFHAKIRLLEKPLLEQVTGHIQANTILISHTPPRGSGDRVLGRFHSGSAGLARLVDTRQPRLVICGHIHEDAGIFQRGNSCVVNCSLGGKGKGVLLEVDQSGVVKMLQTL